MATGTWSVSGTTSKTATYKNENGKIVAKITGLKGEFDEGDLANVLTEGEDNAAGKIALTEKIVGNSTSVTLTTQNGGKYELALGSGLEAVEVEGQTNWKKSGTTATLRGGTSDGWTIATGGKSMSHQAGKSDVVLAKITGLKSSFTEEALKVTDREIGLSMDELGTSKVLISSNYGYTLALSKGEKTLGFESEDPKWSYSGTTATYKESRGVGYTLADDSKSIAYTAAKTATLVTVKGLDKNISEINDVLSIDTEFVAADNSDPDNPIETTVGIIKLNSGALTTTNVTIALGKDLDGVSQQYTFEFDSDDENLITNEDDVVKKGTNVWAVSGTTATYKNVTPAYYELKNGNKTVEYHKQSTGTPLATIKGLAKGLVANNETSKEGIYKDDTLVISVSGDTITVERDALQKSDVTLTNGDKQKFKLKAGEDIAEPEDKDDFPAWTFSGTTATYKTIKSEGWEITDTKLTYKKAATITLATLSGIAKVTSGNEGNEDAVKNAINVAKEKDSTTGKINITLGKDALGKTNITLKNGTADYALVLDTADATIPTETEAKDVWSVSGTSNTTATYKSVIPAHFAQATKTVKKNDEQPDYTKIVYTPEADEKYNSGSNKNKSIVHATITGLAKGLVAGADGIYAKDPSTDELQTDPVVSLYTDDENNTIILVAEGALADKNVVLTTTEDYKLSLGDDEENLAPGLDSGTPTWTAKSDKNGTTATLAGKVKEGYVLNDDGDKIEYKKASTSAVLATVTGLKSDLTSAKLNADDGLKVEGTSIKLPKDFLNKKDVEVTSNGYGDYEFDFVDEKAVDAQTGENFWEVASEKDSTTLTYKHKTLEYYAYDKDDDDEDEEFDGTKVLYNPETVDEDALITLTGLKGDLELTDNENAPVEGINLNSNTVTVSRAALDSKDVTFTSIKDETDEETYSLELDDAVLPSRDVLKLNYSKGTVTLKKGVTAGYAVDEESPNKITYMAETASDKWEAKITGLKDTLDDAEIEYITDETEDEAKARKALEEKAGIAYNDEDKTFTLSKEILADSGAMEIDTGKSTYKLALNDEEDISIEPLDGTAWDFDPKTGTATYKNVTRAYYKLNDDNNVITVTPQDDRTDDDGIGTIATITGLSKTLTEDDLNADEEEGGIDVGDGKITLTKKILLGSADELTLTYYGDDTEYTLDLKTESENDDLKVPESKTIGNWAYDTSKGTATFTQKISEGWKIYENPVEETPVEETESIDGDNSSDETSDNDDNNEAKEHISSTVIKHTTAKTATTTISGLVTGKKASELIHDTGEKDGEDAIFTVQGIDVVTDETTGESTIILSDSVLNEKSVKLTNKGANNKLDLANPAVAEDPVWKKVDTATSATYVQDIGKGYVLASNTSITYGKGSTVTLATVNGLKKGIEAEDGRIEGVEIIEAPYEDENGKIVPGKISLNREILNNSNVTIAAKDNYEIVIDENDCAVTDDEAHWNWNKGTATLVKGKTAGWAYKVTNAGKTNETVDYKTLVYTAAKPVTLATVSGLNKNLALEDDEDSANYGLIGVYEDPKNKDSAFTQAIDFSENNEDEEGVITLNKEALEGVTGSVKLGANDKYTLDFGEGVAVPKTFDEYEMVWSSDGKGTAKYQYNTGAGWAYKVNNAGKTNQSIDYKTVNYKKDETVVLATLSGLSTNINTYTGEKDSKGKATDVPVSSLADPDNDLDFGIEITSEPETDDENGNFLKDTGVITFTSTKGLAGKAVKLTSNYFTLAVDEDLKPQDFKNPRWYLNGTTATLKDGQSAGYTLKDSKNITFTPEKNTDTLATITGLNKEAGLVVVSQADIDTYASLKEEAEEADDIIGKIGYYTDTVDETTKDITDREFTEGISVEDSDDGGKLISLKNKENDEGSIIKIFGTTDIKLTPGKNSATKETYDYKFTDKKTGEEPGEGDPVWTVTKGTAKLQKAVGAGFTLDAAGTTYKYSKAATNLLATVTGLNPNVTVNADGSKVVLKTDDTSGTDEVVLTENNGVITVEEGALNKAAVKLTPGKGYDFSLALGENINPYGEEKTEWVVSGTTATYKTYEDEFYAIDEKNDKQITYTKATTGKTHLTVSGLTSGLVLEEDKTDALVNDDGDSAISLKDNIIEVSSGAFNKGDKKKTNITLKINDTEYSSYALALADSVTTEASTSKDDWVTAPGKTVANKVRTWSAGYRETNATTLTYLSKDTPETIASVSGLAKDAKIDDKNGTITLEREQLGTTAVKITKGDDYTLALDTDAAPEITLVDTPWSIKSGTASLMGQVTTAGFTLSLDRKSAVYTAATAANKTVALATIKGLGTDTSLKPGSGDNSLSIGKEKVEGEFTAAIDFDKDNDRIINFSGEVFKGNVSVDGGVFYSFNFDDEFNGVSIVGSANSDSISVAGTKVSVSGGNGDDSINVTGSEVLISGGKGNDRINLDNSSGGNTLIYASGDGNDVIADFTSDNKIKVTNVALTVANITTEDKDTTIKVGSGLIKLSDFDPKENALLITDKSNKEKNYGATSSSDVLLRDDNYITASTQLSDLVEPYKASYSPYDFESKLNLTKDEKFTPELTFSKDK